MISIKKALSLFGILCLSLQLNCAKNIGPGSITYLEKKRKEIKTPAQAQMLLNKLKYDLEDLNLDYQKKVIGHYEIDSPRITLKEKKAHCLEAALLVAYLLEDDGHNGKILSMKDILGGGHAIYIYKENGLWGAIGKSQKKYLQDRQPKYKKIIQLVESYNQAIETYDKSPMQRYEIFVEAYANSVSKLPKNWATKKQAFKDSRFLDSNKVTIFPTVSKTDAQIQEALKD